MDYNVARQLKDAGFPQKNKIIFEEFRRSWETMGFKIEVKEHIPTLSELIKECGEEFYILKHELDGNWKAIRANKVIDNETSGKTPEEAVAMLYLKINKK